MHALHLPPQHLLRAALLALLLAFAFGLMAAGIGGAGFSLSDGGGGAVASSAQVSTPPGPPAWVTSPLTPPTAELAR